MVINPLVYQQKHADIAAPSRIMLDIGCDNVSPVAVEEAPEDARLNRASAAFDKIGTARILCFVL